MKIQLHAFWYMRVCSLPLLLPRPPKISLPQPCFPHLFLLLQILLTGKPLQLLGRLHTCKNYLGLCACAHVSMMGCRSP